MVEQAHSLGRDGDRLDGWKEIAAYLRKDVRTAIRWSKHEGMPIYRHAEGKRGAIYAYRSEIDEWIHNDRSAAPAETRKTGPQRFLLIGTGVALAALVGIATWLWPRSSDDPSEVAPLEPSSWILIASFDNRTGDERFDGTLETAMRRELAHSRHVLVVPPEQVRVTLELMKQPAEATIDVERGREICLRLESACTLLTGRLEEFSSTYLVALELLDPADGRILASYEEEAPSDSEVLRAVRRLSDWLRHYLGEELQSAGLEDRRLEPVTTESLKALELYSKGMQLFPLVEAEPLFRQAIDVDPHFASAHLYLFWSLYHQRRGTEQEALDHLRRAMELAGSASEEERFFIEATYYDFLERDQIKACGLYKTLAQLFPDHFFAAGNSAHVCGSWLGYREDYLRYVVEVEKMRSPEWTSGAAAALAFLEGDFDRARPYVERLRQTGGDSSSLVAMAEALRPSEVAFSELFAAEELLHQGLLEAVQRELERVEQAKRTIDPNSRKRFDRYLYSFYLALGQLQKAREMHNEFYLPSLYGTWSAFLADDLDALEDQSSMLEAELRRRLPDPRDRLTYVLGWNMGWDTGGTLLDIFPLDAMLPLYDPQSAVAKASEGLEQPPLMFSLPKLHAKLNLVLGRNLLLQGRADEAIQPLRDGVQWFRDFGLWSLFPYYFLGTESLAVALLEEDDPRAALAVLEMAAGQRRLVYSASMPLYHRVLARLATLDRELGRIGEAEEIENQLREGLRLADRDHPILVQLRESRDVLSGIK